MAEDRRLSGGACSVIRLQEGYGAALRLELVRDLDSPAVLVQVRPGLGIHQQVDIQHVGMPRHGDDLPPLRNPTKPQVVLQLVADPVRLPLPPQVGCNF